ncbi:MAG: hypothetical protein ACSHXF_16675 [Aquaticitalea sp.]
MNKTEIDTSKLYQKINIPYYQNGELIGENEAYVSKKKDTFWNTWKFYKNGVIDSSKSKFYDLKVEGLKGDSILKGIISFYSPADSIPPSKVSSRDVTFLYLQREHDSLIFKEIKTNKNVIHFEYKVLDSLKFVGYISDFRFLEIDSLPNDEVLLNQNFFAVDSEISTDNPFVKLLK